MDDPIPEPYAFAVVPITASWKHAFTQGLLRFGVVGAACTLAEGFLKRPAGPSAHLSKHA